MKVRTMENKRRFPFRQNTGERQENGQRISVRPGNFNPPPQNAGNPQSGARQERDVKTAPISAAPARAEGAPGASNAKHRNRHRRRGGNRPMQNPAQNQQNPRDAAQNPVSAEAGGKPDLRQKGDRNNAQKPFKKDRRHGAEPNDRRETFSPQANDKNGISAELRRELDEEFSASLSFLPPKERKEATGEDEIDLPPVDIATAAYLTDDIPCGFPKPEGNAVEVVGVRFRGAGKVYFFDPKGIDCKPGDAVLVDTARGEEMAEVTMPRRLIAEKCIVQPLRAVLRRATKEDLAHDAENRKKEQEAMKICAEKIAAYKLDMKLADAQYTFNNSQLLFYFTSEGRVDFRDLVRSLASIFHTRIELRQIGIRDEARLVGGIGMCGRPFCCATFLSDFGQISVKMAKDQGLSINAAKNSGCCGRLMCCLRYEHETYVAESKLTPAKGSVVETPDGQGVVVDTAPLAQTVKVRLDSAPQDAPRAYHRDLVRVLAKNAAARAKAEENAAKEPAEETEEK